jgi:hypothetical protein
MSRDEFFFPGTVNDQVVDSVITNATLLTGQAPSHAFGILDTVMAETLGMSMHNAVLRQQSDSMVNSAATTATCAKMLQSPYIPFPLPATPSPSPSPPPPPPGPWADSLVPPQSPPPPPADSPVVAFAQANASSALSLQRLRQRAAEAKSHADAAEGELTQAAEQLSREAAAFPPPPPEGGQNR